MNTISPVTAEPTVQPASDDCISCGRPASDGIPQPNGGLQCEQCCDLRYDAYLDWYDSR
jgi:hypothetical protein